MTSTMTEKNEDASLAALINRFESALDHVDRAKPFAKENHISRLLEYARKLMAAPGGIKHVYKAASRFDRAGVFQGSDWNQPEHLLANLVPMTFASGQSHAVTLECLSELRLLAISKREYFLAGYSEAQAARFLTKVLALNLHELFGTANEATRVLPDSIRVPLTNHLNFLAEHIGFENVLDEVISEVWRILGQRPVKVDTVKIMIARIAACLHNPEIELKTAALGADSLVSALYGPTNASREDPGIATYLERVQTMHSQSLNDEANAFARAMHDTGLVSDYHAALIRELVTLDPDLLPAALGLSATGRDVFYCYRELVLNLIDMCVFFDTSQAVYGLSALLERGILYQPGVANSFWRQTTAPLSPEVRQRIETAFGTAHPAYVYLLAGLVTVLGQPLGLGQGNNPVCQSTRAISMWAYSDPDYLIQLTRWAARDDSITMTFEGETLLTNVIPPRSDRRPLHDLDPVSLVLVPHLDRVYDEMARRCGGRGEDYHKWLNPEFHGWRVHRGFAIAVDVNTRQPADLAEFYSRFFSVYHPMHNNNMPIVHPQPAGLAITDSQARYVGWHAVTILRVAIDHENIMRLYFFNPNNDSGQNWGNGVEVGTHGHGERPGESSLPFDQFASRLYLFHFDPSDYFGPAPTLDAAELDAVAAMAHESWVPGLNNA